MSKLITLHQALAIEIFANEPDQRDRILNGEDFVYVYHIGAVRIRFVKDTIPRLCGVNGCHKPGVQNGRCWKHADA